MREAQRRGREDALSGREPTHEVFEREGDWIANYTAGRNGGNWEFAPLPWPAELAFAAAAALGTELAEQMRPRYPLARWAEASSVKVVFGARRRRARQLGLGGNAELPLLKANPNWVPAAIGVTAPLTFVLPRLGVRRSVVSFTFTLATGVACHWFWRRAGLLTRPAGTYRPSAPA